MRKKGFLVTIASPSGGGKSTICKELLRINPTLCYSISWTTRPIRGSEVHGKEYFFTDVETFKQKVKDNFFLEHAEVHGNFYGTSKEFVEQCLSVEKIILFDIDVQGVDLIKKQGYNIVTIFILPPHEDILKKRLTSRGTDSHEVIAKRLVNARREIDCLGSYDYLVINDEIENAISTVNSILIAEQNNVQRYIDPREDFYGRT
jgi:guanylate kinase